MNLLTRTTNAFSEAWKALTISFTGVSGREIAVRGGNGYGYTGTDINWDTITGEFWQNASAWACYRTIALNYTQAPPLLQKRVGDQWETVPDNLITNLLQMPYAPFINGSSFAWAYLGSLLGNGNAYLGIEENMSGQIARLKWLPHTAVEAMRDPGSKNLIDWYKYTPSGESPLKMRTDDLIHLRYGINLADPRYGLSGYAALKQQQYTLQQAVNYNANILRNNGTPFALATPKEQSSTFDPQSFLDLAKPKVSGDKVGQWMSWNEPIDLTFPNVTPETMALDTMQDRPESDISAVFGVPPQVAGLHVGRLSKTYANVKEARESFWEETVIPLLLLVYGQIGERLLPRFGYDTKEYRLYPDITEIRPLQPDKDALHTRTREDFKSGMISLATALTETGRKPEAGDEAIYFTGERGQMMPKAAADPQGTQTDPQAQKSVPDFLRDYMTETSARAEAYKAVFGNDEPDNAE